MGAGKKTAKPGPAKAAPMQGSKANTAAAAAPVTVQASDHVNSKYTAAPAIPADPAYPAESLSEAHLQPWRTTTPQHDCSHILHAHALHAFVQIPKHSYEDNAGTHTARQARRCCTRT